jgi:segregation and condensation protein B
LLTLFDEDARPIKSELVEAFKSLQADYQGRGIELQEVASGLRFQVSQSVTSWVARLQEERPQRYSRALLETIAIIAYRQPLTRGDIEEVRGVAVSTQIIKTLQEREWVRVVGHRDVPGHPALYATTRQFLDYFNLKSLDQLPPLSELKDLEQLNRELDLDADTAEALHAMIQGEKQAALGLQDEQQSESAFEENTGDHQQSSRQKFQDDDYLDEETQVLQ